MILLGLVFLVLTIALNAVFYYSFILIGVALGYFLILAGWFSLAMFAVYHFILEAFLTPKESKLLRQCKIEKRIPLIVEHDAGILEFKIEKAVTPEGAIICTDGWIGFIPRPIVDDEASPEDRLAIAEIAPVVAKRSFLAGVGMPCWVGYTGKGVLTNLRTLAELEHGPHDTEGSDQKQEVPIGKGSKVNIFWPVKLSNLKKYFSRSWNQATVRAMEKRAEAIGVEKERKRKGPDKALIYVLLAAGFAIAMAIILVVAAKVLA